LVAPFTREEPNSNTGVRHAVTAVPPLDRQDNGGAALCHHLAGHWHHHGVRRPLFPGVDTPLCHGCNPTGPPEPEGMQTCPKLPSSAAETPLPIGGRTPSTPLCLAHSHSSPLDLNEEMCVITTRGDRHCRRHPYSSFAWWNVSAVTRRGSCWGGPTDGRI
jgi:hypothetical protein